MAIDLRRTSDSINCDHENVAQMHSKYAISTLNEQSALSQVVTFSNRSGLEPNPRPYTPPLHYS